MLFRTALFALVFLSAANAEMRTIVFKGSKIQLDLPKDWENVEGLFGAPLTILGPLEKGARPTIVISGGEKPASRYKFTKEEFEKTMPAYEASYKAWAFDKKAVIVKMHPYENTSSLAGHDTHSLGMRFFLNDITFDEHSYYVLCKGKVFHFKTLLRDVHESTHATGMLNIVRSFQCE